jgi:hypothetical protein
MNRSISMNIDMFKSQMNRLLEMLVSQDVDVTWSSYDDSEQVINEIKIIENSILNGNVKSIEEMNFLLSPTGGLQEISISSGWGDEFLEIAESLEYALSVQAE